MAISIIRCAIFLATANCRASRSTICAPASASRSTPASAIRLTLCCGRLPRRASRAKSNGIIHGGGQDLQFPHHENEIAQSEGAHQHGFVNYWMHNGFVRVDNEKMSKSLGNFFTIRDVLKKYDPEVIRFFILRAHYRSPLNYSDAHLDDARVALTRFYTALKDVSVDEVVVDQTEAHALRFTEAINDDFNTPVAIAVLFDLANEVNKSKSPVLARQLKALAGVIGLLQRPADDFLKARIGGDAEGLSETDIAAKIAARVAAKKAKNFAEADGIRAELAAAGVILEDKPGGLTEWRRG